MAGPGDESGSGTARPRARVVLEACAALLLVAASTALTLDHARDDAATVDEPVHLAAAVEIARQGTGRWNPEHPPLAKALAGLALSGLPLDLPADPLRSPPGGDRLVRFLFLDRVPAETILFRARLPFAAVLALLLLGLRAAGRRLAGEAGGLAALALAALDPNLVAHAGVVHTDLCVTAFVVLAVVPLLSLREERGRGAVVALGLCWGLAALSKFSAPLLAAATLPMLALAPASPAAGPRRVAGRLAAAAGIAALVLLGGYALAYRSQTAGDRHLLAVDRLESRGRSPAAARLAIAAGDLLPPAGNYLTGALSVALQSGVGGAVNYLCGTVSREGFPLYFPIALAVKTPLGLLLAAAAGIATRRRAGLAAASVVALLLAASMRTTYNIGVRHLLLVGPLLALAASGAAMAPWRSMPGLALRLSVLLAALELAAVHPFELSYFNPLGGGLSGGHRLLVDSNLDWGQDLVRLARAAPLVDPRGLPAVVFGGDLPARHVPALRLPRAGEEDVPGTLVAFGETPLAIGPELLRAKGAAGAADELARWRQALRTRGRRVGAVGGSIGIWRIERAP